MPYYFPLTSAAIIAALGYTPVNRAGDTMTGGLGLNSTGLFTAAGVQMNIDAKGASNNIYFYTNSAARALIGDTGFSILTTLNINPASGLTRAIWTEQTATGTIAGPTPLNRINVTSDDIDGNSGGGLDYFVDGLQVLHNFGGSAARGGRQGLVSALHLTSATSSSNTNRNYVGGAFTATAESGDGGTGVTAVNSKGAIFGAFAVGVLESAATNIANVTGMELNVVMESGSSAYAKSIIQISGRTDDVEKGAVVDAMIWGYKQGNTAPHWDHGIRFGYPADANSFPFDTNSTVLAVDAGTIGTGIDLSAATVTDYAYRSPNFHVTGAGDLSANAISAAANIVSLAAIYSTPASGNAIVGGQAGAGTDRVLFQAIIPGSGTWYFGADGNDSIKFKLAWDSATFASPAISITTGNVITLGGALVTGGYIEGAEQTAPSAPAANGGRIFFQDNGAGKTQLMVIFASGAAQQLAIEP